MSHNFTDAVQTVELFHPTVGCGSGQPVSMTFRGRRCTSNNGTSSSISMAGVLWQTAEPAAGSGLDAAKCALQRRAGAAADDLIFNMDWFGSCGVPPARVQFIPRSECPAAPPPPPPSPSPRPDDQKALDRGGCRHVVWSLSANQTGCWRRQQRHTLPAERHNALQGTNTTCHPAEPVSTLTGTTHGICCDDT
jgi:hypothetical protein